MRHCSCTSLEVSAGDVMTVRTEATTGRPCPGHNNITNEASSTIRRAVSHLPPLLQGGEWEKNDRHHHQQGLRAPPRIVEEE